MLLENVLILLFYMQLSSFPGLTYEETVFFHSIFLPPLSQTRSPRAWVYLWAVYPVPLVYMSVLCQYYTVLTTIDFQYSLKLGGLILFICFLKITLAIQCPLGFHRNWKKKSSNSVNNAIGNLRGNALDLQIALGSISIFTILTHPIHQHTNLSICVICGLFHQCFILC